jgi:hypothetical protein
MQQQLVKQKKFVKCKNCSYQFDPSKKVIQKKGNVECAALEILIL